MNLMSEDCIKLFGEPGLEKAKKNLFIFVILEKYRLKINCLPYKIYCNPKLYEYLLKSLDKILWFDLSNQIYSWNGCFNIRKKRGANSYSLHSWGVAFDINAKGNPFGGKPEMSKELVDCFSEWFDWGGYWKKPDGMHFQLKKELL